MNCSCFVLRIVLALYYELFLLCITNCSCSVLRIVLALYYELFLLCIMNCSCFVLRIVLALYNELFLLCITNCSCFVLQIVLALYYELFLLCITNCSCCVLRIVFACFRCIHGLLCGFQVCQRRPPEFQLKSEEMEMETRGAQAHPSADGVSPHRAQWLLVAAVTDRIFFVVYFLILFVRMSRYKEILR